MRGLRSGASRRHFVAAVAATIATVAASAPAAAAAADGPRLAFTALTALKPRGFSLGTVGPDGVGRTVLLRGSERGIRPDPFSRVSWSPDGTWLYFGGGEGRRKGVYKLRADGSGLRFLRGTQGGRNPVLSADGGRLAFTRDKPPSGFFVDATSVWVADSDGRGARRLTPYRGGADMVPSSFAPDGSRLAVTEAGLLDGRSRVLLQPTDRRGGGRLLAADASEAAFSPDGSTIALVRHTMSRTEPRFAVDKDLHLVSADGSRSVALTDTPTIAETHPSWEPEGHRLAFNAYHNSKDAFDALFDELLPVNNSIVEINPDGSCRRRVLKRPNAVLRGPTWQPGPGRVAGPIEC